jgi:N-acetylglucosamine-6-sulfatase
MSRFSGILVLLAALAFEAIAPCAASAAGRPNVILIVADDLDLLSAEDPAGPLRHTQELVAGRGVRFAEYVVSYPLCTPARVTLLTGLYAHNHLVRGNRPPAGGYAKFEERHGRSHLAHLLRDAGYRTALVGKYMNDYPFAAGPDFCETEHEAARGTAEAPRRPASTGLPAGWDEGVVSGAGQTAYYDYWLCDWQRGTSRFYGRAPEDYKTDVLAREAVRFIMNRAGDRTPFFLLFAPPAPHDDTGSSYDEAATAGPTPAPRHAGVYADRPLPMPVSANQAEEPDVRRVAKLERQYRRRLESLLALDEAVRDIVQALAKAGKLEETAILFTSDNGFAVGQHGRWWGKNRLYEEDLRVPFYLTAPDLPANVSSDAPAADVDVMPTVLALAGIAPPRSLDGRSLLSAVKGDTVWERRAVPLESGGIRGERRRGLRTRRHKLNEPHRQLFDLESDPYEANNVYDDPAYGAVRADMKARLRRLVDCAGDGCWEG